MEKRESEGKVMIRQEKTIFQLVKHDVHDIKLHKTG